MKTTYSAEAITSFLSSVQEASPQTLKPLNEGHISQAFSFETLKGDKLVLRIADRNDDFKADTYAANHFGIALLVPEVNDIGQLDQNHYYIITRMAEGKTTDMLSTKELTEALPNIQAALAKIYSFDISQTKGYGPIDTKTGDAPFNSWEKAVVGEIYNKGNGRFKVNASNIGLNPDIIDKFFIQIDKNLPYASETRRLYHGDPAFNNMIVNGSGVTAIIDWAQMGYGDWMSDFARLEFWAQGRYGSAIDFASTYGLEADNIEQRMALYWATNALWAIEFADKDNNKSVTKWLRENIENKLV